MIPPFLIRDRDRIVATHVCHHWRDTFLSTPALWGVITTSNSPDKTVAYLERSGDMVLNVSITANGQALTGWSTSFRTLSQHSHRFGAMSLYELRYPREDVFAIMDNPFPHLTELELEIPDEDAVRRIEGPQPFPPLKSLILHGDMTYVRCFQPSNLRKLAALDGNFNYHPCSSSSQRRPCLRNSSSRLINAPSGSSNSGKMYHP